MAYEFSPIKFDNTGYIRDSVFSILRNAILDGKLEPGQRLVERNIAEQLRISRTPVREAIRKLEIEKLVTHIPRKGVVVSGFTKEDIEEIQVIRISLEALSCSIAASKIKEPELKSLDSINNKMLEEYQKGNVAKSTSLNRKFHESIYKAAKSPHLYYFVSTLREYISKFTKLTYTKPGRLQEAFTEHSEIIKNLRQHNSDGSYNSAKKHVEKSSEAFLKMAYFEKK
ncbi:MULTISPECIES: GntR family transcriptional regulator [Clostridium]|uniref:HTH-type transcriptional regulator McbR n=1 Tax=Clostridium ragsdalei P11 TaxID=1353534 RepID=A0A1A6AQT9_9CLOT|nr:MULTISPECIES: GntR family transcriptional regulator [Clostridium]OBR92434.1 HTH-type transcriptional regulator McbR [Clostridium ragsdalei P11]QXE18442.1 GntR family transcriptional regulator [Clostridium sp. 001]